MDKQQQKVIISSPKKNVDDKKSINENRVMEACPTQRQALLQTASVINFHTQAVFLSNVIIINTFFPAPKLAPFLSRLSLKKRKSLHRVPQSIKSELDLVVALKNGPHHLGSGWLHVLSIYCPQFSDSCLMLFDLEFWAHGAQYTFFTYFLLTDFVCLFVISLIWPVL